MAQKRTERVSYRHTPADRYSIYSFVTTVLRFAEEYPTRRRVGVSAPWESFDVVAAARPENCVGGARLVRALSWRSLAPTMRLALRRQLNAMFNKGTRPGFTDGALATPGSPSRPLSPRVLFHLCRDYYLCVAQIANY